MPYATLDEIKIAAGGQERLVELTDVDSKGKINSAVLEQAQTDAETWIDSFARKQYTVPFDPIPTDIARLAAAETIYRLKKIRERVMEQDRTDHEERLEWLRDLAAGRVIVSTDDYPVGDGGGNPTCVDRATDTEAYEVSRETLKGYC